MKTVEKDYVTSYLDEILMKYKSGKITKGMAKTFAEDVVSGRYKKWRSHIQLVAKKLQNKLIRNKGEKTADNNGILSEGKLMRCPPPLRTAKGDTDIRKERKAQRLNMVRISLGLNLGKYSSKKQVINAILEANMHTKIKMELYAFHKFDSLEVTDEIKEEFLYDYAIDKFNEKFNQEEVKQDGSNRTT